MEEDSPDAGTGWPRAGEDFPHHPVPSLAQMHKPATPFPALRRNPTISFSIPFLFATGPGTLHPASRTVWAALLTMMSI